MYAKDQPLSATSEAAKAYLPLITKKGTGIIRASKPKDGNAAKTAQASASGVSPQRQPHSVRTA
ncbi:MAG: hypothetical protein EOP83_05480 [Verrucomicrobiaceae bacterium]|nr:MAG: hypothetical protein EOP83_05480 [Verrucomicrobiaceae bacterium]